MMAVLDDSGGLEGAVGISFCLGILHVLARAVLVALPLVFCNSETEVALVPAILMGDTH
jgi:hypothetical protein